MEVSIAIHLGVLPDGRYMATALPVRAGAEADTPERAVFALRQVVQAQVRAMHPAARAALVNESRAEALSIEVDVPREEGEETALRITVSVVVTRQTTTRGVVHRVRAPLIPQLDLALPDRDTLVADVRDALTDILSAWNTGEVLACDDPGAGGLDVVTVTVPAVQTSDDDDEDAEDILAACGTDLTARAVEGRLGALHGRDALVERVLALLASGGRGGVMLVGPSGAGKTALVDEIARRLAEDRVPAPLSGRPLWRITANDLVAGMRYLGEWQQRAQRLVTQAREAGAIVCMDDPAAVTDAGRANQSDNNLGRFLRPHLDRREITVICEATQEVLAAVRRDEPGFADAFDPVEVPAASEAEAGEIVAAAAREAEERTGVTVLPGARGAIVELPHRFEPYGALPGTALRLLEETVREADGGPADRETVVRAFTRRTGLPAALLSDAVPLPPAVVRAHLEDRILGQPEAVDAMTDLVAVVKAGLTDPAKPLGTFFFVGPTGVGKTEMAKVVAELLFGSRDRMVRFDMGEYGTADAVHRLVGAEWSRQGEGQLTRAIRQQPFCVLLFDEIEKADAGVFDALLGLLGEGRLTDARGRTADFRNAIVIMTSNLGARRAGAPPTGFTDAAASDRGEVLRAHFVAQAEAFFRPEFVNRIDRVVPFHTLDDEAVRRIVRRELGRLVLRDGLVRRRLLVEVDESAVSALAQRGMHPRYGARPLQREVERSVAVPLSRILIEQAPEAGDLVRIAARRGVVDVTLTRAPAAPEEPPAGRAPRAPETGDRTLVRLEGQAADLVQRVTLEDAAPGTARLREEVADLLARTAQPTFWDDHAAARAVLDRAYRVEGVLDRLDQLRARAETLVETARQVRLHRDRRAAGDIARRVDDLEERLALTRLELAGAAAAAGPGRALLRVTPVGPDADGWADRLRAMYRAWGERTGRDIAGGPHPGDIVVDGPAAHALLSAEAGLHRLTGARRGDPARLARVSVGDPDGGTDDPPAGPDEVVRVYGGSRGVRDPLTGIRVASVEAVLGQGRIESFLVARLRRV